MRAVVAAGLAIALLAQGCDDEPVDPPCDITEKECQKAIFRKTAAVRGQDDAEMPPTVVITREQYRDALENWLAEQEPDPEADAIEAGYALLGVLPRDMGAADEAYIDDLAEGVAAFYSPYDAVVTIISDPPAKDVDAEEKNADDTFVLAHEFMHALQHQRGDLTRPKDARDTDSLVAFDALVEGEAVFLSNQVMAELADAELAPEETEEYFDRMTKGILESIAETEAPLYLAGEILPYPLGGRGVFHAFDAQGLAGIEALHAHEPRSVAYWLADEEPPAAALRCDVPAAPTGFKVLERDRLGVVGLVALDVALGKEPSLELGGEWTDDRVAIYASADLAQIALAYRVRFAATAAAEQLETALAANDTLQLVRSEDELLVLAANSVEGFDTAACPALAAPVAEQSEALVQAARRRLPFMR